MSLTLHRELARRLVAALSRLMCTELSLATRTIPLRGSWKTRDGSLRRSKHAFKQKWPYGQVN
jgi:hypothetical protein